MLIDTLKTGPEAARRTRELYTHFLKKHKRQTAADILYALSGEKPYVHQVVVRGDEAECNLIAALYKEVYP